MEGFENKKRRKPKISRFYYTLKLHKNLQTSPKIFSVKIYIPYVNIHKDLNKIKTKVAFNLTKRQLICFGTAAVIGTPAYIFTRNIIGNTGAVLLMIGLMLPPFLFAMYEKDGQPAEKILRNYIRARFYWPGIRPYKTENFYEIIEQEGKNIAAQKNSTTKTIVGKYKTSKK